MRRVLVRALLMGYLVVAAGCFSPTPQANLPCADGLQCPTGQWCDPTAPGGPLCVVGDGEADARADGSEPDRIDAATDPGPDGAPSSAVNDRPEDAIDVGNGGDFPFDTSTVADDFDPPCSGGGADVFFTITLAEPEVIYLDTFGTDFDAVIVVLDGDCTPLGGEEACVDDACGSDAQGAWNLDAGTHCIIVDQGGPGQTGTDGHLAVVRGGHHGIALPDTDGMMIGNTCSDDDDNTAACGCGQAEDVHYFLTLCPGVSTVIEADVCTTSGYDAVMQIRTIGDASLDCSDDEPGCGDSSVAAPVNQPGLYWVIMDGCAACGGYSMKYSY